MSLQQFSLLPTKKNVSQSLKNVALNYTDTFFCIVKNIPVSMSEEVLADEIEVRQYK